jgi:uncharacterized protein YdiU (UPF0061 family)
MGEVTSKLDGDKISYALFKELETGAFRAIPNDGEAVATLFRHLQQSIETKKKNKEHIRQKILDNYSWDKTTEKYIEIFDSLEPKNMWEVPLSINPSFKVNSNSTNRQFVTTIIKNVIQSPHLLQSTYIQNMIRYLDEGYINAGGNIVGYNVETAKKNLEQLLNHKVILEEIRSKEVIDNSEFLKYGQ